MRFNIFKIVIPAEAGIYTAKGQDRRTRFNDAWIPASAGMTILFKVLTF
ncbi:MAG TPA: hypothetical protein VEC36_11450 [Patescibacteria group bacterium]|nr:hypothetical protein [Patescibacteria group bacterium]